MRLNWLKNAQTGTLCFFHIGRIPHLYWRFKGNSVPSQSLITTDFTSFTPLVTHVLFSSCLSSPRFSSLCFFSFSPSSLHPSTSNLSSCQSGLSRCWFSLSGWGTRSDQPWTLIDLSGEMTATSEDMRRQVHVMWQDSFIPPPSPPLPTYLHFTFPSSKKKKKLNKKKHTPMFGECKRGMCVFPDEARGTFLLRLSGCDAATWWGMTRASFKSHVISQCECYSCPWSADQINNHLLSFWQ